MVLQEKPGSAGKEDSVLHVFEARERLHISLEEEASKSETRHPCFACTEMSFANCRRCKHGGI